MPVYIYFPLILLDPELFARIYFYFDGLSNVCQHLYERVRERENQDEEVLYKSVLPRVCVRDL